MMPHTQRETTDKVDWNLSQALIMQIDALLNKSNMHYLRGQAQQCFFNLKAVKMRFVQNLDPKERALLSRKEQEISKHLPYMIRNTSNKNLRAKGMYLLEKYNETIMILLDSYGFLLGKKKDSTVI